MDEMNKVKETFSNSDTMSGLVVLGLAGVGIYKIAKGTIGVGKKVVDKVAPKKETEETKGEPKEEK